MGNERATEKRELLKLDYPKNLLYAVRGGWEDEEPTELTQDVLSGISPLCVSVIRLDVFRRTTQSPSTFCKRTGLVKVL